METRRRVEEAIRREGTVEPRAASAGPRSSRCSSTVSTANGRSRSSGASSASPSQPPRPRRLGHARPLDARPRLDRGSRRPPPHGRDRGLLRPERVDAPAAGRARDPVRGRRPDRRAAPRHAVRRGDELEWRADRDASPARAGPPADRRPRRSGLDPLQPRPDRRLSLGDGRGRRRDRPGADQLRQIRGRGGHRREGASCSGCRTGRRRSSPATTSRPSGSTRPRARRGSTSRRT